MGIQIFPIINGQECRGLGDGKSLAKTYIALQMSNAFSAKSDNIMRVDFKTGKIIQPASQVDGMGIDEISEIISEDPSAKRDDYENGINAAGKLLRYLKDKNNEDDILNLDGMDSDYLLGAIAELENILREITRAKKFELSYSLWISV